MVQQAILFANGSEQIALTPLRQLLSERRVLEIRPLDHLRYRHQSHQVDRAVAAVNVGLAELQHIHQELLHLTRAVVSDFESYGVAPLALFERVFQLFQQVFGVLFVNQQVGVSSDPELITAAGFHARKQLIDISVDDAGEKYEIIRAVTDFFRDADQSGQRARGLHHGQPRLTTEGILAVERDDEVE